MPTDGSCLNQQTGRSLIRGASQTQHSSPARTSLLSRVAAAPFLPLPLPPSPPDSAPMPSTLAPAHSTAQQNAADEQWPAHNA